MEEATRNEKLLGLPIPTIKSKSCDINDSAERELVEEFSQNIRLSRKYPHSRKLSALDSCLSSSFCRPLRNVSNHEQQGHSSSIHRFVPRLGQGDVIQIFMRILSRGGAKSTNGHR